MTAQRWRIALWVSTVAVALYLAYVARWALLPFAVGAIFAYVLTPAVDRIASIFPAHSHQQNVVRRGLAVLVIYAVILMGIIGAGLAFVPVAIDQTVSFIDQLPDLIDETQTQTNEWLDQYRDRVPEEARERIDSYFADLGDDIGERFSNTTTSTFDSLGTALGVVFGFLVVPVWMFYALRDRHTFGNNFDESIPREVRPDVQNALTIADKLLGRYLRGQLFLGLVVGLMIFIGLTLLDVELSFALAIFAGITELIPIIGPWIGAVPALLIVAASDPDKIVWVALLYFGVQQAENNLLVPRIQGHAVDLHPAMIILLLVIAGAAFGFIGLVVVVPLAALLRELFWYADHRLRGLGADEAMARTHVAARFNLLPAARPSTAVGRTETSDEDDEAAEQPPTASL
jgi:predicted PurR-regulated permease PerM